MRSTSLTFAVALSLSLSSAWPWPPSLENLNAALGRRQPAEVADMRELWLRDDPTSTDANAPTSTFPTESSTPTATPPPSTAKDTAATSGTGKTTTGSKTESATKTTSQSIPPNAAAGGISMITPAQTTQTYGKIGHPVTFVWNYTSLLAPPSNVDVIASNTDGVWTITSNMSVKETGSVVWNTSNLATPLPMESYTLVVYDAEVGITAVPSPGHLNPFLGYQFAMYSPKPAVADSEFVCVTCNSAVAGAERQSLTVMFGTTLLTVLSFTYFSSGFLGVI